jgi:hypothetical protein
MGSGTDSERAIIERVLANHAKHPYAHGEIDR